MKTQRYQKEAPRNGGRPLKAALLLVAAFFSIQILPTHAVSRANAHEGGGAIGGNGGRSEDIEFTTVANIVADFIEARGEGMDLPMKKKRLVRKLRKAIRSTQVTGVDYPLYVKGVEKDAKNYPLRGEIYFNLPNWKAQKNPTKRAALVYHEYLGILRIKDRGGRYSNQLLDDQDLRVLLRTTHSDLPVVTTEEIESPVYCAIRYHDREVSVMGPFGRSCAGPTCNNSYFGFALLESESGNLGDPRGLAVLVDSGDDPYKSAFGTWDGVFRVQIGRGAIYDMPPVGPEHPRPHINGELYAEQSFKWTPDFEEVAIKAPSVGVEVNCHAGERLSAKPADPASANPAVDEEEELEAPVVSGESGGAVDPAGLPFGSYDAEFNIGMISLEHPAVRPVNPRQFVWFDSPDATHGSYFIKDVRFMELDCDYTVKGRVIAFQKSQWGYPSRSGEFEPAGISSGAFLDAKDNPGMCEKLEAAWRNSPEAVFRLYKLKTSGLSTVIIGFETPDAPGVIQY